MEECANCGISETSTILYDAISNKGIIKLCSKCLEEKNLPKVKKFSGGLTSEEQEPKQTVYERLRKISGYDSKKEKPEGTKFKKIPNIELTSKQKEENQKLKSIVKNNISEDVNKNNCRKDLIDNFHWFITRERRRKKLTKEEFAREINEPEEIIDLAEKGLISKENSKLVEKIENYLGIRIRKNEKNSSLEKNYSNHISDKEEKEFTEKKEVPLLKEFEKENVDFRSPNIENLKIGDLKKIKEEKF